MQTPSLTVFHHAVLGSKWPDVPLQACPRTEFSDFSGVFGFALSHTCRWWPERYPKSNRSNEIVNLIFYTL